ncbi:MAG: flagellar basal body P-ring formation protein FlgA [Deltaproteobacteria bacterium]|nr:flagellar basal body P-ring formation protein FlgA [Deltaproteobacteria bacterium]
MNMIVLLTVMVISGQGHQKTYKIKRYVKVEGSRIILNDLVKGVMDPKLGVIELTGSPLPGQRKTITREMMRKMLHQELPGVKFVIPTKISVYRKFRMLRARSISRKIRDGLIKILPRGASVNDVNSGINRIRVPYGRIEFIPRGSGGSRGRWSGRIDVMSGNEKVTDFSASVLYSIIKTVPVSTCMISSGRKIRKSCIGKMSLDITRYQKIYTSAAALQGTIARRVIPAGVPFLVNSVKLPDIVKRGARVLMIAKIGKIKATAWGIAKSDGYLGKAVRIMNPRSKKMVTAFVVAPNTVRVGSQVGGNK